MKKIEVFIQGEKMIKKGNLCLTVTCVVMLCVVTGCSSKNDNHSGISHQYIYDDITSKSYWGDRICVSIDLGRPAVLDINTQNVTWPYKTNGHYVNVSGYSKNVSDLIEVRITDPFGPGLGNNWYSVDTLYQANEDHFRQAFIW